MRQKNQEDTFLYIDGKNIANAISSSVDKALDSYENARSTEDLKKICYDFVKKTFSKGNASSSELETATELVRIFASTVYLS